MDSAWLPREGKTFASMVEPLSSKKPMLLQMTSSSLLQESLTKLTGICTEGDGQEMVMGDAGDGSAQERAGLENPDYLSLMPRLHIKAGPKVKTGELVERSLTVNKRPFLKRWNMRDCQSCSLTSTFM